MNKNKFFIILLSISLLITILPAQNRKYKNEDEISNIIDSKKYSIDVNFAFPLKGGSVSLTSNYSLTIKGDSVYSYLPYYGVAYNIPYGGGKGLIFNSTVKDYYVSLSSKGKSTIKFTTSSGEDRIDYTIGIFKNGQTTIYVQSNNRQSINYSGCLNKDSSR